MVWPGLFLAIASLSLASMCITNQLRMPGQSKYYKKGIDVSHHQGEIDWKQFTPGNSGMQFVIAKATEGATYQDPMFLENVRNARATGFWPGAYHFLRFGSSAPSQQMENFVRQIRRTTLLDDRNPIIALDIEEHQGADYTLVRSVTEESVRYLKGIKITPYIYTRKSFWDPHVAETPDIVKQCPLWIARWRKEPPSESELPNGWNSWDIWQYSSTGEVPGIVGDVDLNEMVLS